MTTNSWYNLCAYWKGYVEFKVACGECWGCLSDEDTEESD